MTEDNSIVKLFDSLLKDEAEKKIMHLIIDGEETEDIIETLLKTSKKEKS